MGLEDLMGLGAQPGLQGFFGRSVVDSDVQPGLKTTDLVEGEAQGDRVGTPQSAVFPNCRALVLNQRDSRIKTEGSFFIRVRRVVRFSKEKSG